MEKYFVTREIAEAVKEHGFNGKCIAFYNRHNKLVITTQGGYDDDFQYVSANTNRTLKAPLWQQVADWLLEEHKVFILVSPRPVYNGKYGISYGRGDLHGGWQPVFEGGETYYGAYDAVIKEALKII